MNRALLLRVSDWTVVAIAVSLPWSTSATAILIFIWLSVHLPTINGDTIKSGFQIPAGELPFFLWTLSVLGMLWATNIGWHERLASASGFAKLLAIPLLLSQFYRSNNGKWVLLGFTISATALLAVSWSLVLLGVSRPNH